MATSNARSARRVCLVLGSPRLPCGRRAKISVEESGRSIRRKIRVSSEIERERTRLPNQHHCSHTTKDRHLCMRTHQAQKSAEYMTSTGMHVCDTRVACMVRSGLYGRAGLSIGSADRSSHRPLARAIVRSQAGGPF